MICQHLQQWKMSQDLIYATTEHLFFLHVCCIGGLHLMEVALRPVWKEARKNLFQSQPILLDIWIQYQLSVMWENPPWFYLMQKDIRESWCSSGDSTLQCKVSALLYRPYNSADGSVTPFYMMLALKLLDQPQERFMKVQGNFTLQRWNFQ